MDPNVKQQTLVETFDLANSSSIPGFNVALITLLIYPVSTYAQLSVASAVRRDHDRREIELSFNSSGTQAQESN